MAAITSVTFFTPDIARTKKFYADVLGFRVTADASAKSVLVLAATFKDGRDCAKLEFKEIESSIVTPSTSARDDPYWKIGLTMPDVRMAVEKLRARGVEVSDPAQFEDIGFVAHLSDPDGSVIELLQHTFHGGGESRVQEHDSPLGQEFTVGQVTLRTDDLAGAEEFYVGKLGMREISTQPVDKYGFTLYFYSYSEEKLPQGTTVEQREWLWQRPYTLLEIQHVSSRKIKTLEETAETIKSGFDHVSIVNEKVADIGLMTGPKGIKVDLGTKHV